MIRLPEPEEGRGHPLEELFGNLRADRRDRYASYDPSRPTGRRSALLTMAHNESVFLPIWLGYYSRFFAAEDIYVLDNDSTDGSTEVGGFVRIQAPHGMFDEAWRMRVIEQHQRELIERYDSVLVTDVDEIVAPDPAWGTLGTYLDRFDEPWVNCLGYELLHMRDREPPFRRDRPVLEQRGYWYANDGYDKPALATEPMSWKPGFHRRADDAFKPDPELRMIHLHRMDFDLCRDRHRRLRAREWSREDVAAGRGSHFWDLEDERFERWFYEESSDKHLGIALEPIPTSWRGVF